MGRGKLLQPAIGVTLAMLLLVGCGTSAPTTGRVEGKVFRSDTDETYAGVEVELWAPGPVDERFQVATTTDEQGHYAFTDLEPGEYIVGVSVEVGSMDNSPCQEFTSVYGLPTAVYVIGEQGFMANFLGSELLVQTAGEDIGLSAGDIVQVDFDLYCHDE
jgi:hypothetical protein